MAGVPVVSQFRRRTILGIAALLLSGCGSLGEPYLGSFPTSSAPNAQQNAPSDGTDSSTNEFTDPALQALPPRPPNYIPSILVVTDRGLAVVARNDEIGIGRFDAAVPLGLLSPPVADPDPGGEPSTTTTTTPISTEDAETATTTAITRGDFIVAADDLFGGLVTQTSEGDVVWFPGTGDELREVNVEGSELVEVGYFAGTPEALTERAGQIFRTRLIDNESVVFAGLEAGEELLDISTTGGIVAVAVSDSACGSVRFFTGAGTQLPIDPLSSVSSATTTCGQSGRPLIGSVAMSPDSDAVAFTIVRYREDGVELATELHAVELTTGAEILSLSVGGSGDVVDSLSFDGSTAVMLRRSSAGSEIVVADSLGSEILDLAATGTPRSVSFARLPVSEDFLP